MVFTVKSEKDNFKNFNTKDVNNIIKNKLYLRAFTDGTLQASNLTSEKILLKNISLINDKNCQNCTLKINEIVKPSSFNNISIFRDKLDFKGLKGNEVEVYYLDENRSIFNQTIILEDYKLTPSIMFNKKKCQ